MKHADGNKQSRTAFITQKMTATSVHLLKNQQPSQLSLLISLSII